MELAGFELLPLNHRHLLELASLAYPSSGHRDPIDHTLIAQAMVEHLDLVSADSALDAYAVTRVW